MRLKSNRRILRFAAFLISVLLVFSILVPTSFAETAGSHPLLLSKSVTIETALTNAMHQKAAVFEQEAADIRAGILAPTVYGETVSIEKAASHRDTYAACLRSFQLSAYRIAIVEYGYEQHYIGTYRSVEELADEIIDLFVTYFYIDAIENEIELSDVLIVCYMAAIEDVYATYYSEDQYADYIADSTANYCGIGVTVTQLDTGYVEVIDVTPDSPAEKAGIALGDIIVGVDGEDFLTLGYTAAVNKIRGEEGTPVTVTVERNGERLDFTMLREYLIEYTVSYKMLNGGDGKIGYIRISQFDTGTFGQFRDAVRILGESGAEKYIFDVRNNPGGQLESVLGVLDYILPDDTGLPLVRIEYKEETTAYYSVYDYIQGNAEMEETYAAALDHQMDAPIAVLCNEYTASAGELFTSCLQDFGAAEVFGNVTYGKGMGQTRFYLSDIYAFMDSDKFAYSFHKEAIFSISVFYYSPPTSNNYEGVGVTPNHVVPLSEEAAQIGFYKLTEEQDNQLAAAIESLASKQGVPFDPSKEHVPETPSQTAERIFGILLWIAAALLIAAIAILTLFLILSRRKALAKEQEMLRMVEALKKTEWQENEPQDPQPPSSDGQS